MADVGSIRTSLNLTQELSCDVRYADDTTLVGIILEKLELATTELEESCAKWGMLINSGKTKILSAEEINGGNI